MAGFNNQIIDWADGGSIVQTMMTSGRGVYAIEWKSAGRDRASETYTDIIDDQLSYAFVHSALDSNANQAHAVGVCHGGTLAAMYSAWFSSCYMASLTIAGSPIDTSTRSPALRKAQEAPMWLYEWYVAMFGGIMPGDMLLSAWKWGYFNTHFLDRFKPEIENNAKAQRFYRWYNEEALDISGKAFLQFIEGVYKNNDLMEGRFKVGDSTVDLGNIDCPVYVLYGESDDVVPPEHTLGILKHVDNAIVVPRECGHLKLFMDKHERSAFKVVADAIKA